VKTNTITAILFSILSPLAAEISVLEKSPANSIGAERNFLTDTWDTITLPSFYSLASRDVVSAHYSGNVGNPRQGALFSTAGKISMLYYGVSFRNDSAYRQNETAAGQTVSGRNDDYAAVAQIGTSLAGMGFAAFFTVDSSEISIRHASGVTDYETLAAQAQDESYTYSGAAKYDQLNRTMKAGLHAGGSDKGQNNVWNFALAYKTIEDSIQDDNAGTGTVQETYSQLGGGYGLEIESFGWFTMFAGGAFGWDLSGQAEITGWNEKNTGSDTSAAVIGQNYQIIGFYRQGIQNERIKFFVAPGLQYEYGNTLAAIENYGTMRISQQLVSLNMPVMFQFPVAGNRELTLLGGIENSITLYDTGKSSKTEPDSGAAFQSLERDTGLGSTEIAYNAGFSYQSMTSPFAVHGAYLANPSENAWEVQISADFFLSQIAPQGIPPKSEPEKTPDKVDTEQPDKEEAEREEEQGDKIPTVRDVIGN